MAKCFFPTIDIYLFMRHLAVARGCVAAATSASALLNASMLIAQQRYNLYLNNPAPVQRDEGVANAMISKGLVCWSPP